MSLYPLTVVSTQLVIAAEEGGESSMVALIVTAIVCFLLVYWILNRFAFGPVLKVIDQRREQIQSDLQKADTARKQAETDQAEVEKRLRNIEEEARGRMQQMLADARQLAEGIQQKSQQDAAELLEKSRRNIEFETEKARETIKSDIVNLTIEATEHLIKERLDDDKQRQLIGDFINRMERN